MDHSEVKHLEQPKVALNLSAAIRLGILAGIQDRLDFCGCAMGTAYTFITGRNLDKDQWEPGAPRSPYGGVNGDAVVAKLFGVPFGVVEKASRSHQNRKWTREECADWLESQGY
jgi:hypothetical protein